MMDVSRSKGVGEVRRPVTEEWPTVMRGYRGGILTLMWNTFSGS
jgi:hypothetical protein